MKKGIVFFFLFLFLIDFSIGFKINETFSSLTYDLNSTEIDALGVFTNFPNLNTQGLCVDRGSYDLCIGSYRSYANYGCYNKTMINLSDGWLYNDFVTTCLNWQTYIFDYGELLSITPSTKFTVRGQAIGSANPFTDFILFGKDTTQNNTCRWAISSKEDDYTNAQLNYFCSALNNSVGEINNNLFMWEYSPNHDFNLSDGNINNATVLQFDFNQIPVSNVTGINDFDQVYMVFWTQLSNPDYVRLDYLTTENLLDPSNTLPDVNVSISNFSYCLVNDTLDIPLNLSTGDKEEDTIYYATKNSVYTNITNKVDFTKQSCIIEACVDIPDYTVFKPLNNGECDINKKTAYNNSQHNLISRSDYYGNQKYMLELNSDCNRADKSFNYVLGSSTGLFFSSYIWDFDNTEELNMSYFRSDGYELLKLQLLGNGTQADLYYNGSIILSVANMNSHFLNFRIEPQSDRYKVVLSNGTQINTYDLVRDPFIDNVQYLKWSPKGKITLQQFSYQATVNLPDFSTTKPTHITISKAIGRDYYTLFVTDSVHLNSDFVTKTIPFNVYSDDSCKYVGGTIGNTENIVENSDFLGAFKQILGHNLKDYLNTLGYYEQGKGLLWGIFFLLLLGLIFTFSLMTGSVVLEIPIVISSLSVGFLAFIIDYTGIFISMLIILALSLVTAFGGLFGGGK